MRHRSFGFATGVWLLAVGLANAAPGKAAECAPGDPAPVAAVLREWFAGLMSDDSGRVAAAQAPGYYAYDGGRRYDGMALFDLIKGLHAKGMKFVWTVQDPDVHIACDTARIAYVNRGSITDSTGHKKLTWLESADLIYAGKTWKIAFLHSTGVPDAPK